MGKEVRVKVAKDGQVTISTSGYQGTACHDATAQLEEALGMTTEKRDTDEALLEEGQDVGVQT